LIGGPEEPLFGDRKVLWNALAATVQETNTVLSGGETLARSLQVPLHGFDVVLWNIFTILIHATNVVLGIGVSFSQTVQT